MSAAEREMCLHEGEIAYEITPSDLGWLVERQGFRPGEAEPWYALTLGVFTSEWDAQQCLEALTIEHTAQAHGVGRRLRDHHGPPKEERSLAHQNR